MNANQRLEEKEKALQNVSVTPSYLPCVVFQAKEEVEALEKKLVQLENELAQTTTNLENSNTKLEEREKALQNVSLTCMTVHDHVLKS